MGSLLDTPKLLDKQIDRLYSLPLEDFGAARDELAKGLRASGDREGAARARLQQQPTVAAWTVNQLARRRPQELRALCAAVDRVSAAELAVPAGGPALREALDVESSALNELMDAAQEILEHEERRGTGELTRVAATLRLGAADPARRRLLRAGRLTGELVPATLDDARSTAHPGRRREERQQRSRAACERVERLQAELRDLKVAVQAAEGRVRDAEREAERTHREAQDARSDLRRVEVELEAACADA